MSQFKKVGEKRQGCIKIRIFLEKCMVICANVGSDIKLKSQGDQDKMIYYAKGIQKYQCDLGLDVEDFSRLGIVCGSQSNKMEEDDDFAGKYRNNENAADESDLAVIHYDNYDDYLYSLPIGVEPISEKQFQKKYG